MIKHAVIWIIANIFQCIGSGLIGLALPIGTYVLSVIFIPIGLVLITVSYYYKFVYKDKNGKHIDTSL